MYVIVFDSELDAVANLQKVETFLVRQTTQLARDGSCQLIIDCKTKETNYCKTEKSPNNVIVSNSELDKNLLRINWVKLVIYPISLGIFPVNECFDKSKDAACRRS
jgi:hypothetical protein